MALLVRLAARSCFLGPDAKPYPIDDPSRVTQALRAFALRERGIEGVDQLRLEDGLSVYRVDSEDDARSLLCERAAYANREAPRRAQHVDFLLVDEALVAQANLVLEAHPDTLAPTERLRTSHYELRFAPHTSNADVPREALEARLRALVESILALPDLDRRVLRVNKDQVREASQRLSEANEDGPPSDS